MIIKEFPYSDLANIYKNKTVLYMRGEFYTRAYHSTS